MWPWGHLAVGYLFLATERRLRVDEQPRGAAVLAAAFATQLPDLVDKPLAMAVPALSGGRSPAHSLVVALLVVALVHRLAVRRGRPDVGAAFGVGYLSHLVADSLEPLLTASYSGLVFLVWPLLPLPAASGSYSVLDYFADLAAILAAGVVPPFLVLEAVLVVAAAALWARHGYPGSPRLRRR